MRGIKFIRREFIESFFVGNSRRAVSIAFLLFKWINSIAKIMPGVCLPKGNVHDEVFQFQQEKEALDLG